VVDVLVRELRAGTATNQGDGAPRRPIADEGAAYLRTVLARPLPDPGVPEHASREAPHGGPPQDL
jgi:hypothetical protein